jgi:hypothetical protein
MRSRSAGETPGASSSFTIAFDRGADGSCGDDTEAIVPRRRRAPDSVAGCAFHHRPAVGGARRSAALLANARRFVDPHAQASIGVDTTT